MPVLQELQWYPMRVTYNRELAVKACLDELDIQNFVPMHYEVIDTPTGRHRKFVPAIHNLIFVRSTQERLTELKMTKAEFEPMRYIMKPREEGEGTEIMRVPDWQMENFMRVASAEDDSVMFLDYSNFLSKVGKRVKIIDGTFAGVEGLIKRIQKNRYVVVQIEGVAAVAITYVPAHHLMEL